MWVHYIHNSLSVLFLILALVALVRGYLGWQRGWAWRRADMRLAIGVVLTMYLQMLLGFYLFFAAQALPQGASADKGAELRFWPVEHFFIMLFALLIAQVALIVVANTRRDTDRFRLLFRYLSVSLLLVALSLGMILGQK